LLGLGLELGLGVGLGLGLAEIRFRSNVFSRKCSRTLTCICIGGGCRLNHYGRLHCCKFHCRIIVLSCYVRYHGQSGSSTQWIRNI